MPDAPVPCPEWLRIPFKTTAQRRTLVGKTIRWSEVNGGAHELAWDGPAKVVEVLGQNLRVDDAPDHWLWIPSLNWIEVSTSEKAPA